MLLPDLSCTMCESHCRRPDWWLMHDIGLQRWRSIFLLLRLLFLFLFFFWNLLLEFKLLNSAGTILFLTPAIISCTCTDLHCYWCNNCRQTSFLVSFSVALVSRRRRSLAAPGGPDINLARISGWRGIKVRSTHVLPLYRGVYTPMYARYMHSVSHFICHH